MPNKSNPGAYSDEAHDRILEAARRFAVTVPELESLIAQRKHLSPGFVKPDKLDDTLAALLSDAEAVRHSIQDYRDV